MATKANATFEGRSEETTKPLPEASTVTGVIESLPLPEEKVTVTETVTETVTTTETVPTDAEGKE